MAALVSTGSPKMSRRATPRLAPEESSNLGTSYHHLSTSNNAIPGPGHPSHAIRSGTVTESFADSQVVISAAPDFTDGMSNILARLRVNDMKQPSYPVSRHTRASEDQDLDQVIRSLEAQQKILKKQETDLKTSSGSGESCSDLSSGSEIYVQAGDRNLAAQASSNNIQTTQAENAELNRIKRELEAAKSIINRQEMELTESRNLKHTMEQAMGPPSETDYPMSLEPSTSASQLQSAFNATARPFRAFGEPQWSTVDGIKTNVNFALADPSHTRARLSSHGPIHGAGVEGMNAGMAGVDHPNPRKPRNLAFGYTGANQAPVPALDIAFGGNRAYTGKPNYPTGIDERMYRGLNVGNPFHNVGHVGAQMRATSTFSDPLSPNLQVSAMTGNGHYVFQDRNLGAPISPISPDFPPLTGQSILGGPNANSQTYITPLEPMNYRRLLDKSVSCDWKYIVDKIVCNNDQQASIFLQQKLKVGTAEQKYEIVESIVNQAYPLMINRFGNFLVQRCFEHGTPEQVIAIANAIHGNVISLSMDPFGCHVIQKAFDSVPEDHKSDMVRELLRRIPDTVIHRYACHVWQKLFELRWTGEPPQIMLKVNEALRGMWHEVALGETGSLVVQNIFENCVEEEKRPAIEEVIAHIDLIAHGQFGNWCIQHLCEHGSPSDKRRVIDHILTNSYSYSIDQFASKVVEKCLKIGGPEFMDKYLAAVTTARPDRPRIPLIDIAGDQYGNYLIQWILMNTHQHQKEQVAIHIRKHMVSLRGSKFGSRVAMLCSNPAAATRPGPPATLISPYHPPSQVARSNAWPRFR